MLDKGSPVDIYLQTLFFETVLLKYFCLYFPNPVMVVSTIPNWLFPPRQGFSWPALAFVLIHGIMTVYIPLESRDIRNKRLTVSAPDKP